MTRLDSWFLFLLAASVLTPRVPILGLGLIGALRLDHIFLIFAFILSALKIATSKRYFFYFICFSILFFLGGSSFLSFSYTLGAFYSVNFLIQLIIYFEIGLRVARSPNAKFLRGLYFSLSFNSIIAFTSRLTGIRLCSEYLNGDILTSPCYLDEYGFSGAPYVFGAHSVALLFLGLLFFHYSSIFLGLISLVLGDSRAFFGAFLPSAMLQKLKSKPLFAVFFSIVAVPTLLRLSADSKVVNGFSKEQLLDRSLGMRLENWSNFLNWIDLKKLFLGDGFAAYLDFAVQYGQPGHPDNLYLRVISEIGLVGCALFLVFCILIVRRLRHRLTVFSVIFILGVLVLGLVQESHLASKSGQIISFFTGLCFIRTNSGNYKER